MSTEGSLDQHVGPIRSRLLHNMSVPPRTVISYGRNRRVVGKVLLFQLPPDVHATDAVALLSVLDGRQRRCSLKLAEQELRERINKHAASLPLPNAAVVVQPPRRANARISNVLSAITVMAKSSGNVYLQAKEPNLAMIREGGNIGVIVPTVPPAGGRSSTGSPRQHERSAT